jgi:hypothetical protein
VRLYSWPGGSVSADKSTWKRAGELINAWVRMDYSAPTREPSGVTATEVASRVTINCSTMQTSLTSSFTYNGGLTVAQWQGSPTQFTDIVPDTPFEKAVDALCRHG